MRNYSYVYLSLKLNCLKCLLWPLKQFSPSLISTHKYLFSYTTAILPPGRPPCAGILIPPHAKSATNLQSLHSAVDGDVGPTIQPDLVDTASNSQKIRTELPPPPGECRNSSTSCWTFASFFPLGTPSCRTAAATALVPFEPFSRLFSATV